MTEKINFLDDSIEGATPSIEMVKFNENELAVIPFTPHGERVVLHYCSEPELGSYVPCLGGACLLCRIGRKQDPRRLLPVYLPTAKTIGVLPVSESKRPHALLPQLNAVLQASQPLVVFIRREDRTKFVVSTRALDPDMDAGEEQIQQFLKEHEAGRIPLTSIYPSLTNHELAEVSGIAEHMKLKGITLDADDSRT
jgi:hypothetical protein